MSELPSRVRRALRDNEAVEPVDGTDAEHEDAGGPNTDYEDAGGPDAEYEVTTVPFDARVRVDAGPTFAVTVRAPTLSAATSDEVADVVEEGWFDAFRRRLEDADMALEDETSEVPTARIEGDELLVTTTIVDDDPDRGVADAKAFVEYVEGTYMEGVVPGYEYEDPVATLRERARRDY